MGHVFKHTYTVPGPNGKRIAKETKKWYLEFWDKRTKKRVRQVGYTDKKATEHLLRQLEQESDRIDAGYLPSGARLAKVELSAHLETYLGHLRAKGGTAAHVALVGARCRTILIGCGLERWRDVDPLRVEHFLAEMRAGTVERGPKCRKSISIQTSNHYLVQFGGFIAWLAGRMQAIDPLAQLVPLNADTDRRHVRRILQPDELRRLIQATASGGVLFGLPGPDRAMLYWCAAYTGYRASELASMTPESMEPSGEGLLVMIEAGSAKNRRQDQVPMEAAVAAAVQAWLAGKPSGKRLWPGEWASKHHAAAMLREDLATAGIPYKDASGRVADFHALRTTFITYLAQSGVPLIHAQRLARHSNPMLTTKHYAKLGLEDLRAQAAKLLPPKEEPAA